MLPKAIGCGSPVRPAAHALPDGAAGSKKFTFFSFLLTTSNFSVPQTIHGAPGSYPENVEIIALPVPEFLADKQRNTHTKHLITHWHGSARMFQERQQKSMGK